MNIKILSFNTWGMKYKSINREKRLKAISHKILKNSDNFDIIALQELWSEKDWIYLKNLTKSIYKYQKRFCSGIVTGPGLVILSKYSIESCFLYRFPLNGKPLDLTRADWFAGKSVSISIIRISSDITIALLNAHIHASYGSGDSSYLCHRTCQAWDISRISRLLMDAGHITILVGDVNSEPESLPHLLLTKYSGLRDAWIDNHGEFKDEIGDLSPEEQIQKAGITADSQLNSFRETYPIDSAQRLDYIFYDYKRSRVASCNVTFIDKIKDDDGEKEMSYSDHFAVEVELEVGVNKHEHEFSNLKDGFKKEEEMELLSNIMEVIDEYKKYNIITREKRLMNTFSCFILVLGLQFGVFWVKNPILTLFMMFIVVFITIIGIVQFCFGWAFGKQEQRTLQEYEEQIQMHTMRIEY